MRRFSYLLLVLCTLVSCGERQTENRKLPILGQHDHNTEYVEGELETDTIYYTIPPFLFTDQFGSEISNRDMEGKIYVADFFFTSCPTICPKMSRNLLTISEEFKGKTDIEYLSFSIDPRHDSVAVLKEYYKKLGSTNANWHFLTGDKDEIFDLAKSFMVSAAEDPNSPGGLVHSGAFILIDRQGRIRAYYDGTLEKDVEKLRVDLKWLYENE